MTQLGHFRSVDSVNDISYSVCCVPDAHMGFLASSLPTTSSIYGFAPLELKEPKHSLNTFSSQCSHPPVYYLPFSLRLMSSICQSPAGNHSKANKHHK